MKYRIKKQIYPINDIWPDEEHSYTHIQHEVIVSFAVQVKNFLFWHTVKDFKKIRQAIELLNILKQEV